LCFSALSPKGRLNFCFFGSILFFGALCPGRRARPARLPFFSAAAGLLPGVPQKERLKKEEKES
jgi:hypothetical protein